MMCASLAARKLGYPLRKIADRNSISLRSYPANIPKVTGKVQDFPLAPSSPVIGSVLMTPAAGLL